MCTVLYGSEVRAGNIYEADHRADTEETKCLQTIGGVVPFDKCEK